MALYTFNFLKPSKSLRFGLSRFITSRGSENYITTVHNKAFLVGVVKVRILGIPFEVILQPDDYRRLAKGFYSRADAVAYAARQQKQGKCCGDFDLERKNEHIFNDTGNAK